MKEKFIIKVSANLTIYIFNIVVYYLLAYKLDKPLMGIIGFTNSLIGIFVLMTSIGLDMIYTQHNADDDFEEYFSIMFFLRTLLIAGIYSGLIIYSLFILDPLLSQFLFLTIFSYMLTNFAEIFTLNLDTRLKIMKASLTQFFPQMLKNTLLFVLILNIELFSNPLFLIAIISILSSIFNLIFAIIISKGEFHFKKLNMKIMKDYLKATKPFILYIVLGGILTNFGKILLDTYYGHDALASYYIVETYLITVFLLISQQISGLFYTYLPIEFKNKNYKAITEITHITEKYSSILFLSLIIVVLLNGDLLFQLILPTYLDAAIYLKILIVVPFLAGINNPYFSLLIPSRNERTLSYYTIIKTIIMLILTIIIVPHQFFSINMLGLGGIGLAWLTLSGWAVDSFFYRSFAKKLGIPSNKRVIFHSIYALVAFLINYILSTLILRPLIQNTIIYLLTSTIILLATFLTALIVFKEVDKQDRIFILNLLKISNYKESFIQELTKD